MINKTNFLKLLNVRPSEWSLVTKLFWLQFFQGTGIAFFFTASFTSFLEKFSAEELAWVMIISSPLLFITGWVFNKFEHKWSLSKLGMVTSIAMAASILLFHIASYYIKQDWFYYLMFAWFYVLYLASNLFFWSITSTLFDVRESKRLFSVISAGDIPAKFIGYTIAYLFVKTIGAISLLWPAVIFMLLSLPFLVGLSKMGVIHSHHSHHDHHPKKITISEKGNKLVALVKRFSMNVLIRRIAVLTFVISCCLAIINYEFYTKVKESSHDDKSLSNFILLFLAFSQIIALLVKLIFTSRITTGLGIKKSLLITPIVLIILLSLIIAGEFLFSNHKIIFYAFAGAAISIEVLKTAINTPVFLAVMQPLNHVERSKAHAIVKGIMDPFAFLFSGVLLIFFTNYFTDLGFGGMSVLLIIFSLLWIVSIMMVNNSYHNLLLKTISSRFFSQDEFTLSDEDIQQQIKKKIKSGNDLEVINILQMLNSQISPESKELIFELLDHPSANVKKEVILLIRDRKLTGASSKLDWLAHHSDQKEVQWLSIEVLCSEENAHEHQKHFLHHHDQSLQIAALSGMLLSNNLQAKEQAEEIIGNLINSDSKEDRLKSIAALEKVKDHYSHPEFYKLFSSGDQEVNRRAIHSIGKAVSDNTLNFLIQNIASNKKHVLDALQAAGEKSARVIYSNIKNLHSQLLKEKLIYQLGKIGGYYSHEVLIKLLEESPRDTGLILKALYRSHYKTNNETRIKLEEVCNHYFSYGAELLHMQKFLLLKPENFDELIIAINMELQEIKIVLLSAFGCLYDHEKIFKIRQGLEMKLKEAVANAMEAVEMTVKMDLASKFNTLFEPTDIDIKCDKLKSILQTDILENSNEILDRILSEEPILYSSWTKAYSMYISKKYSIFINQNLIKKFEASESLLLQEMAKYAEISA